jgi:uncharacterized membrane protein YidH (DUF202 family)
MNMETLKRIWYSKWFAIVGILVIGILGAMRWERRRRAMEERERSQRLEREVKESIKGLNIDIGKPTH